MTLFAAFMFAAIAPFGPPDPALQIQAISKPPPAPVLLVPNACSVEYSTGFPWSKFFGSRYMTVPRGTPYVEPGFRSWINGPTGTELPVYSSGYVDTSTPGTYVIFYAAWNPVSEKLGTWKRFVTVGP